MEGLTICHSRGGAVRTAFELYLRHTGQTVFNCQTTFVNIRQRYKYIVFEFIENEKNRCVAVTYKRTERKTIEKRQLPDGTTKTEVLKTEVLKLVDFREY